MAQVIPLRGGYYSDFRYKGKRIRRFLSKNEREAWLALGLLVERIKGEVKSRPNDLPWETFKERLFHGQSPHKRANTQKRDRAALSILEREFDIKYLSDVTPKMLRDLTTIRLRAGRKPSSVKREISSLKAKMRWAEEEGYRTPADWRSVKLPKVPKKRPHYHTREELLAIMQECKGVWLMICWLGARAGLRREEIYWLAKEDVNFDEDLILVCAKDGWQPKDSDERAILLLPDLKTFLARELPKVEGRWVLGDRPSPDVMSTYFKRITKRIGLTGGLHTLRHTYLTHLANDGVNIYALKEWAGHSDIRTTMGYIHPAQSYRAELSKIRPLEV